VLITLCLKWHATLLAQIQKIVDRAHAPCENSEFATGSRLMYIYRSSLLTHLREYQVRTNRFVVAYHQCLLSHNMIGIRVSRNGLVRETYRRFQRDLPVALLLAIHILSNEKLLNVVPSAKYLCTHRTERINCRNIITTSIVYRPLQTNLNSTL